MNHRIRSLLSTLALAATAWALHGAAVAQGDPLARAAAEKGAVVTDSGLVLRTLKEGAGGGQIPPNAVLQFEVELLGINGK
ncbi:MAG: hypothetical protein Q8M01_20340 [Rubrivivax sp.]|nr:hypothetical protein [Rubrivivax sp.]